jgi:RNA polymerase sigma-70 factor, ECF subfamily
VLAADDLERFRTGDPDAVRAVYRAYGRLVFAVARSAIGSAELAEEITQQTFLKAWKAASTIEPGRDLAPWLVTIARRTAIDLYRVESRQVAGNIDDVPAGHRALVEQPPSVERTWEAWQVRQAVDELPDEERELMRLQHVEGLTQSQVAERLGVPIGTVKSRTFRAHKRLAAKLGHLREGFD